LPGVSAADPAAGGSCEEIRSPQPVTEATFAERIREAFAAAIAATSLKRLSVAGILL
jgi:hypothetical protein